MNVYSYSLGNSYDSTPDLVLLCQHHEEGDKFMARYPKLAEGVRTDTETFSLFRKLEADRGTPQLASSLAIELGNYLSGRVVTVVQSPLPRSIIDTNRRTRSALRNSIAWQDIPSVAAEMTDLHMHITDQIRKRIRSVLKKKGVFVDIHSMAPFTPLVDPKSSTEAVDETPENLPAYIRAYTDPSFRGERRHLDLVTGLSEGQHIADPKLSSLVKRELSRNHMKYCENQPYPTALHVMTTEHMIQAPGLAIDVPKDMLLDGNVEDGSFNTFNSEGDYRKIELISGPLGRALARRLGKRNR